MSQQTIDLRLTRPDLRLSAEPRLALPVKNLECRDIDGDAAGRFTIAGHAAVFDVPSEVLYDWVGPFREFVNPGFFSGVLEAIARGDEDTKFLGLNHDRNKPHARTGNKALTMEEDSEGLAFEATPAPTASAQELRILIAEETVAAMSFTFTVTKDGEKWTWGDGMDRRDLLPGGCQRLFDISPVVYAAYEQTDVDLRSIGELRHAATEIAAGRRSADPAVLATIGHALSALQDVPQDLAERALKAAAGRGSDAPKTTEPPVDEPRGHAAASRARRLRLREFGHQA